MPVPSGYYGQQGPSCFDKMKMGFTMGFCVGLASGAIFGGFGALRQECRHVILTDSVSRYGLRGRELISQVGKTMIQGGGTFGVFMAIGTGIRC
ncbi:hypothetical protein LSH36_271g07006 [Paralvinella palmiformis]|uniref:Reactive oxygen species modulator 1 n=1 Tax=Paralvinella palmiformis TaxID=53620 RepID=A0AAD9N447_9ANNE|nr:hypothetical protein LSH36_271g07006 [Paralvinella palmiformis]